MRCWASLATADSPSFIEELRILLNKLSKSEVKKEAMKLLALF